MDGTDQISVEGIRAVTVSNKTAGRPPSAPFAQTSRLTLRQPFGKLRSWTTAPNAGLLLCATFSGRFISAITSLGGVIQI